MCPLNLIETTSLVQAVMITYLDYWSSFHLFSTGLLEKSFKNRNQIMLFLTRAKNKTASHYIWSAVRMFLSCTSDFCPPF